MAKSSAELISRFEHDQDEAPVVLVTGGAGTIGSAIAERVHRSGCRVVLVDREGPKAEQILCSKRLNGIVVEADLESADSASGIMKIVEDEFGRLDGLVNNAGISGRQRIEVLELDLWERVMAINLRAAVFLAQKAIPFWERKRAGSIVNIGSRVWVTGAFPAYAASKAGMVGATRALAVELGHLNVRANVVAPGYVDSELSRGGEGEERIQLRQEQVKRMTALPRIGTAEDIANAVAFLLSDEASFITGEVLHVCGGSQLAAR